MIYKPEALAQSWVLETGISKGIIFLFRQYVYQAKKTFKYKHDKKFLNTLEPNTDYTKPFLYIYDNDKGRIQVENYPEKIKALVDEANKYYMKDKEAVKAFDKNYRIDLMGNWQRGYIILMKRSGKKVNVDKSFFYDRAKKQVKQVGSDISDTWRDISNGDKILI